jgi:hypothetical protein
MAEPIPREVEVVNMVNFKRVVIGVREAVGWFALVLIAAGGYILSAAESERAELEAATAANAKAISELMQIVVLIDERQKHVITIADKLSEDARRNRDILIQLERHIHSSRNGQTR